ncbi:MAG: inner membrane complex domain-containing protein [Bacteroides sp.]|nr:inner membrane complex domain-containing protein [Bacteroides sp.]
MKKIWLFVLMCAGVLNAALAQGDIQFTLQKSAQGDLSQSVVESLDLKLKQILNRNSAAAANAYNVFAIEPVLQLTDELTAEGLMQDVSVVKGELTLFAKNSVDGTMYYSMTIPVRGNGTGGTEKALKTMISNIKTTDTQFTRFIRITRQKIQDYYAANCATILQKAQGLYDLQKYQEALAYLSAISETLPCYEQASVLQAELVKYIPAGPDTVIVERVVEKPVEVEKIVEVEKVVEKPVVVEKVVEKPVIVEVEKEPEDLDCEISISVTDLDVRVLRCYGNTTQKRITIQLEVVNRNDNILSTGVSFLSAFTIDGEECTRKAALSDNNWWHDAKLPSNVKVKQDYYVLNVSKKIAGFSFIELKIRDAKVIIRNLPVEW